MPRNGKWTRGEKLALGTLIVGFFGVLGTWITKLEFQVKTVRNEIKGLQITVAKIDSLKSKLADIESLTTSNVTIRGVLATTSKGESGRMELMSGQGKWGWALGVTGKNLSFEYLENGRWVARQTLTSTGFVSQVKN